MRVPYYILIKGGKMESIMSEAAAGLLLFSGSGRASKLGLPKAQ